jgi:polysaccharide pyruvyl transferase WcaK-like protein
MNIVFSTTRQWNPGDEFILLGCINLLKSIGLEFNPIIYNRNPQIRRKGNVQFLKAIAQLLTKEAIAPFLDNSLKDTAQGEHIDLVVFAGSPEWRGGRLAKLYKKIIKNNIPVVMLGIGTNRGFSFDLDHFSKDEMQVLDKALLITCRDELTFKGLKEVGAHYLPCPAILSASQHKVCKDVQKIGLIYGTNDSVSSNNVSMRTFNYLKSLYQALQERFQYIEFEFIAHYIDELETFSKDFPTCKVRYSYDAKDYIDIYGRYDLVVGHRIHGVGMSASQGIPGFCISHDSRGTTAKGFLADVIEEGTDISEVIQKIEHKIDHVTYESQRLKEHRENVLTQYQNLLAPVLKEFIDI